METFIFHFNWQKERKKIILFNFVVKKRNISFQFKFFEIYSDIKLTCIGFIWIRESFHKRNDSTFTVLQYSPNAIEPSWKMAKQPFRENP